MTSLYRPLRIVMLVLAYVATLPTMAHVLEMGSKLTLDGSLWLQIQQHLYRGWGDVFGPVEILALLCAIALLILTRGDRRRRVYGLTTLCYAAMLACFFIFNNPVNTALNGWTVQTLPADWSQYRLRWEIGHALAALFSLIAFVALLRLRQPRKLGGAQEI